MYLVVTIFLFEHLPIVTTTTITIITTTIITITTMIITTTTTKACNRIWEEVFRITVRIPAKTPKNQRVNQLEA